MTAAAAPGRKSQAEADLDALLVHSGGPNINRGARGFIVELADAGAPWDEITKRLTASALLYGRTYASSPPRWLADEEHAREWALTDVEREQRRRARAAELDDEGLTVVNAAELLKLKLPPRQHLLRPIMPEASIGMIHGPRGLGKTNLALGIAAAVAFMKRFLRFHAIEARRVLFVDGELPLPDLQARVAATITSLDGEPPDPDSLRFLTPDLHRHGLPDLSTPNGQALLEPFLDGVALLILDNISTLFRSGVENEAESWGPVQAWALKLRRLGIATWFVHHSGKGGLQRGTSRREDVLDTVIGLRRPSDYRESQGARFELHFEKHRSFHGDDAEPLEAQLTTDEQGRQVWTMKDLEDRKTERVAELLNEGFKTRDIASKLGIGVGTVDRHKKKAADRGLLNG